MAKSASGQSKKPKTKRKKAERRETEVEMTDAVPEGDNTAAAEEQTDDSLPALEGTLQDEELELTPAWTNFARALVNDEQEVREAALAKLELFLKSRTAPSGGVPFSLLEMKQMWKCLFHTMWICDKLYNQQQLAEYMSTVLFACLATLRQKMLFAEAFFFTMLREWPGLDQHRQEKYMYLIRQVWDAVARCLAQEGYSEPAVRMMLRSVPYNVLNLHFPAGTAVHVQFCDVYFEQIGAHSPEKVTHEVFMQLCGPLLRYMRQGKDPFLIEYIGDSVFLVLLKRERHHQIAKLANNMYNLRFDCDAFATTCFQLASDPRTRQVSRKFFYKLHTEFKGATLGELTFAMRPKLVRRLERRQLKAAAEAKQSENVDGGETSENLSKSDEQETGGDGNCEEPKQDDVDREESTETDAPPKKKSKKKLESKTLVQSQPDEAPEVPSSAVTDVDPPAPAAGTRKSKRAKKPKSGIPESPLPDPVPGQDGDPAGTLESSPTANTCDQGVSEETIVTSQDVKKKPKKQKKKKKSDIMLPDGTDLTRLSAFQVKQLLGAPPTVTPEDRRRRREERERRRLKQQQQQQTLDEEEAVEDDGYSDEEEEEGESQLFADPKARELAAKAPTFDHTHDFLSTTPQPEKQPEGKKPPPLVSEEQLQTLDAFTRAAVDSVLGKQKTRKAAPRTGDEKPNVSFGLTTRSRAEDFF